MSLWKKVVFSLLISTAFFTAGIFFFFTGGFDFLEVQFYEPRIIDNIHKELRACASDFTDYYNQFDGHFSAFVQKEPVTTFIDREVSEENVCKEQNIIKIHSIQRQPRPHFKKYTNFGQKKNILRYLNQMFMVIRHLISLAEHSTTKYSRIYALLIFSM